MMRLARLLAAGALLAVGGDAAAQPGQPEARKEAPDKPRAATRKAAKPEVPAYYTQAMFFLAKGGPDACGPGCSEWIAVEGTFDRDSATRFRTFLRGLGKQKLPVFFHSPGGFGTAGLEIGRMLRERRMTAGVGRTIPSTCDGKQEREPACDALKRSGRPVAAELRTHLAQCNSACGFAIMGAVERQVAPGTVLGIHAPNLGGVWVNGFLVPSPDGRGTRPTPEQIRGVRSRYLTYLADMGIDRAYLDAVYGTPHRDVRLLTRTEIVRFGIDTRKFVETPWHMSGTSLNSVMKWATQVHVGTGVARTVRIDIACAPAGHLGVILNRELADPGDSRDAVMLATDANWVVLRPVPGHKPPEGAKLAFEPRIGVLAPAFLDQAIRAGTITLTETPVAGGSGEAPRVMKISTAGLASLRDAVKACTPRLESQNALKPAPL